MITVNGKEIVPERFPDVTYRLDNVPVSIYEDEKNILFKWIYQSNEEMILLYMLSKHYRSIGRNTQYLDMPYIPNARMDRTHGNSEVFTLKYFCEFINSLHFNEIWVFDPHSGVSSSLLDNCRVFTPDADIKILMEKLVAEKQVSHILFPDEGAMKRYSAGNMLKFPYLVGMKTRDWKTGKITGLKILNDSTEPITGVLIVDDICSYGGTFVRAGKELAKFGVTNNYLYVSHCEQSIVNGDLVKNPDESGIKQVFIGSPSMYDGVSCDWVTYLKKD